MDPLESLHDFEHLIGLSDVSHPYIVTYPSVSCQITLQIGGRTKEACTCSVFHPVTNDPQVIRVFNSRAQIGSPAWIFWQDDDPSKWNDVIQLLRNFIPSPTLVDKDLVSMNTRMMS